MQLERLVDDGARYGCAFVARATHGQPIRYCERDADGAMPWDWWYLMNEVPLKVLGAAAHPMRAVCRQHADWIEEKIEEMTR